MGAASILRAYLGLSADEVVPLSISHGIDYGHCAGAMDLGNVEPIHWSYNHTIHDRARTMKPSALVPHPWLLLEKLQPLTGGRGLLVIGPPPGPENDTKLLEALRRRGIHEATILIKCRGHWRPSIDFWNQAGYSTTSAGERAEDFYQSLFRILSQFEVIISGTFSSAVIFAAALGKPITLVHEYRCRFFDTLDYTGRVDFSSETSRALVRKVASDDASAVTAECRAILGSDLEFDSTAIIARIEQAASELTSPVNCSLSRGGILDRVRREVALLCRKPGVLQRTEIRSFIKKRPSVVSLIDLAEIPNWLHGSDMIVTRTAYIRGVTEPGYAAVQYER